MAKKITVFLLGGGELQKKLKDLTTNETKSVIRGGCREALRPIAAQARTNAPRDSGGLARNIKIRSLKRSRRRVGARVTIQSKIAKHRYSFVLLGRKTGTKTSARRAKIAPDNFLKMAATSRARDAISIFNSVVDKHIRKVIGKRK